MCEPSRREFLKLSAAGTAAAALSVTFPGPACTAEARALADAEVGQPVPPLGPGQK